MNFEKVSPEQNELQQGEYSICVNFKLRNGKDYTLPLSRPISIEADETVEDLKKKAISEASATGLHNFGMDTYVGKYPNGQSVKFILKHELGKEIEFSQNFDGNGYPVKKK